MKKLNIKIEAQDPRPLYLQFKEGIVREIQNDYLTTGTRIPSTHELIKMFNLSYRTIEDAISQLVREGYLYRRPKRGTFVSGKENIKNLGRMFKVAFVVQSLEILTGLFTLNILKVIEQELSTRNYDLEIVLLNGRSKEGELNPRLKDLVKSRSVDGLILYAGGIRDDQISKLKAKKVPFVLLHNKIPNKKLPGASLRHFKGMEMVTNHLISLGHTKIGYIGAQSSRNDMKKLNGYKKALIDSGLEFKQEFVKECKKYTFGESYNAAQRLLEQSILPTGIVCGDDVVAIEVIKVIESNGLKVPQDIAVVGFHDMDIAETMKSFITTVRTHTDEMVKTALKILFALLEPKLLDKMEVIIEPELIIRKSSGESLSPKSDFDRRIS